MKGSGLALVLAIALAGCLPSGVVDNPAATGPPAGQTAILPQTVETASEQPISEPSIPSIDAVKYVGQTRTVCGPVISARHLRSRGRPTLIYFDKPQPEHTFTVLIWGADRDKFPANLEDYYEGRTICVDGLIREHSSGPFIEVKDPSQVSLR